jgi:hypothetical protein
LHLVEDSSDDARAAFYAAAFACDPLSVADDLVRILEAQPAEVLSTLLPHARWLVSVASHVPALRIGLVLLGRVGTPTDLPTIRSVGRHDAFTLYAGIAAAAIARRAGSDPTDEWWALARAARGWGKIHAVERLGRLAPDRSDIQDWLLRDGCANAVMDEYLGYICATVGNLRAALAVSTVDRELLDGASTIVRALLDGGPVEDISDYDDGPAALTELVRHLATQATTLPHLYTVHVTEQWLDEQRLRLSEHGTPAPSRDGQSPRTIEAVERYTSKLRERGWTAELCEELAARCRTVMVYPWWQAAVRDAFDGEDPYAHRLAWRLGPAVGLDLWEDEFARLRGNPIDGSCYTHLTETRDPERFARLIRFAEEALPLERVATGPADALFRPPGEPAFRAVTWLVQAIARRSTFSPLLVATALRSPVVSLRNSAVRALAGHSPTEWGEPVQAALARSLTDEPNAKLRDRVHSLLEQIAHPDTPGSDGQ